MKVGITKVYAFDCPKWTRHQIAFFFEEHPFTIDPEPCEFADVIVVVFAFDEKDITRGAVIFVNQRPIFMNCFAIMDPCTDVERQLNEEAYRKANKLFKDISQYIDLLQRDWD